MTYSQSIMLLRMHDHANIVEMLVDKYGVDVHAKEQVNIFIK